MHSKPNNAQLLHIKEMATPQLTGSLLKPFLSFAMTSFNNLLHHQYICLDIQLTSKQYVVAMVKITSHMHLQDLHCMSPASVWLIMYKMRKLCSKQVPTRFKRASVTAEFVSAMLYVGWET